jgi:hypothetical protein
MQKGEGKANSKVKLIFALRACVRQARAHFSLILVIKLRLSDIIKRKKSKYRNELSTPRPENWIKGWLDKNPIFKAKISSEKICDKYFSTMKFCELLL